MKCLCCCASNSSIPNRRKDENDTLIQINSASHSIEKTKRQEPPLLNVRVPSYTAPILYPKVYTDSKNKEWLLFLAKEDQVMSSSSYLYDIENDMYFPFINNYKAALQIVENLQDHKINNNYQFGDYIIDNSKHVMYILECRNGLMIRVSIFDLHDIKVIDSTFIENKLATLFNANVKMMLSNDGKLIHIMVAYQVTQHFIFNIETGICEFIEDIVGKLQSKDFLNDYTQVVNRQKTQVNTHDGKIGINIQIGALIDARDFYGCGTYYLAKIIDVKPKNSKDLSKDKKLQIQLENGTITPSEVEKYRDQQGIFVHYHGWKDKWDCWIYIDDNHKIFCNCIGFCHVSSKYHRIAPVNTQSRINNEIQKDWRADRKLSLSGSMVYSDHKICRMKIFKPVLSMLPLKQFSKSDSSNTLLGYKIYQRYDGTDSGAMQLLVYGYTRRIENKWNIIVPVELCNMIQKYYDNEKWYMDSYTYNDELTANNTDVVMSNDAMSSIHLSSKKCFVKIDDDYNIIVILDEYIGVYAIDLNRNMIFYIMKKDEIFDESIQHDNTFKIYPVVAKNSKQIHIFVGNQHFSIPITAFVSRIQSTANNNHATFVMIREGK